jgi:hypothetical protein
MVNLLVWPYERVLLCPSWCLIPNSATDTHQQGPNDICSHTTTELTTSMYLIDYFNNCNFSKLKYYAH